VVSIPAPITKSAKVNTMEWDCQVSYYKVAEKRVMDLWIRNTILRRITLLDVWEYVSSNLHDVCEKLK
jgi:hypothetical protein